MFSMPSLVKLFAVVMRFKVFYGSEEQLYSRLIYISL